MAVPRSGQLAATTRCIAACTRLYMCIRYALRMAQDENEYNREAAVKLLNEIAPDMGQEICEYFIVPTFKSLGLDTHTLSRIKLIQILSQGVPDRA